MSFKDFPLLSDKNKNIVLFHPYISKNSLKSLKTVLSGRWIGQGPMVDKFENKFTKMFAEKNISVATGSGTDALHMAYILAGLKRGDEVITTIFTCTATNIPLLYMGVKIKFADVDPLTMNISVESVKKLINKKTKAIICVHYGGLPCDLDELNKIAKKYNIPIIEDAAQALGAKYNNKSIGGIGDFTTFSFQAIKHITTGDGGILTIKNKKLHNIAKRIGWFGINREGKQKGTWENDIFEVGYKYQMNDLGATLGYESLKNFRKIISHRRKIFDIYLTELSKNKNIHCVNDFDKKKTHAAWLFTIVLEKKDYLQRKLREYKIETNQVHFRNDKYSIFKKFAREQKFKNMDYLEDKYLVLPLHLKVSFSQARYISNLINKLI
jgi:dTDP-4-amino-4,6-dideoxygalactose transaminase